MNLWILRNAEVIGLEMGVGPLALGEPMFCSACLQPLLPLGPSKRDNGITSLLTNSRTAWCSDGSGQRNRAVCWHPTPLENKQC